MFPETPSQDVALGIGITVEGMEIKAFIGLQTDEDSPPLMVTLEVDALAHVIQTLQAVGNEMMVLNEGLRGLETDQRAEKLAEFAERYRQEQ